MIKNNEMHNYFSLSDVADWFWTIICGWLTAALCYFFEIRGAINIMLIIIFSDLVLGICASIWRRKEVFSMEKFTLAILRAFVFTAFVAFLYALDKETHQTMAATYYIATYIIAGGYLWSSLKNAELIFGGWIFKNLKVFFKKEIKSRTGLEMEEK